MSDRDTHQRLLASLVAGLAVVQLTDHPLVAMGLLFPIMLAIWVWS